MAKEVNVSEAIEIFGYDVVSVTTAAANFNIEYYTYLREKIALYEGTDVFFPPTLFGKRRIVYYALIGGVVAVHYYSENDGRELIVGGPHYDKFCKQMPFVMELPPEFKTYSKFSIFAKAPVGLRVEISFSQIEQTRSEGTNYWSTTKAKDVASAEVEIWVLSHLMKEKEQKKILTKLKDAVTQFEQLLVTAINEEEIQQFLKDNHFILDPTALYIKPKVKLGSDFTTDFVIAKPNSDYVLVEIEQAKHKLFTRNGDQTSLLSHALGQVQDWKQWLRDNIAYARTLLPNINEPHFWIIIGRDHNLNDVALKKLQQMNATNFPIHIYTYDSILRIIKQQIANLEILESQIPPSSFNVSELQQ